MIQPEPKDEPRMSPYEAPKAYTKKDDPIHEEGCAICEAVLGAVGDHEHMTKERVLSQISKEKEQVSRDAEIKEEKRMKTEATVEYYERKARILEDVAEEFALDRQAYQLDNDQENSAHALEVEKHASAKAALFRRSARALSGLTKID